NIYDEDEILNVLDEQNKIEIAECITNNISVVEKNYSEELMEFILKNKFDINDLSDLIINYSNYSNLIQNTIEVLAITNFPKIIEDELSINDSILLKKLLDTKSIDLSLRKELFADNLSILHKDEIKKYLSNLDFSNTFLQLFSRKRPRFEINNLNLKILEHFKVKGWIYSYKKDGDIYRAIGKPETI
ncbi:hypothetical protein FAE25_003022, partial [Enterococcus faecalis]|nr:hypothetical protein [Enterococcus faecalis]